MNLIYDRTAEDVERALALAKKAEAGTLTDTEKTEWLAGMKGCYNATDMNRVEAAVKSIAAELKAAGYPAAVEPVLKGSSRVPVGYTEVEWIQSSGSQYIDTGLVCNKADDYELNLDCHLTNDAFYAGANGYMQFQASVTSGVRCNLRVAYKNNVETISVDGVVKSTKDWTSAYSGANVKIGLFRLGGANNGWESTNIQSGKIYSGSIKKSAEIVRRFLPCKNADGAAGLYDLVGGTFYTNSGTGAFTAGAEIGKAEDREWQEGDVLYRPQWTTYLDNVQRLRDAYYTLSETGQLPDAEDRLEYIGANNIEKVLADIDLLIGWMKSSYRRCGTFQAGNNAAHLPLKGSA